MVLLSRYILYRHSLLFALAKMSNRIVILTESPFSYRDYKRFDIEKYISLGYTVKVLDCSRLLAARFASYANITVFRCDTFTVAEVDSIYSFCKEFFNFNPRYVFDFAIDRFTRRAWMSKVYLLVLIFIASKRVIFRLACLPSVTQKQLTTRSASIASRFFEFILSLPWRIFLADYTVVSGLKSEADAQGIIIRAHSHDYDHKFSCQASQSSIRQKYFVYLDQNTAYSTDRVFLGKKCLFDTTIYFEEINYVLSNLEQKLGLKCIVSPHPRANLDVINKMYKFDLSELSTYESINESSLVVCHDTTAVQMAILAFKPILFWIPDQFKVFSADSIINAKILLTQRMAELLGTNAYASNQLLSKTAVELTGEPINRSMYTKYINNYSKQSGSSDSSVCNIVDQYLKSPC